MGESRKREDWAKIYDVSTKTITRWMQAGQFACPADPPPLESPQQMVAWYTRVHRQEAPKRLQAAISRAKKMLRGEIPSPPPQIDITPDLPFVAAGLSEAPDPRVLDASLINFQTGVDFLRTQLDFEAHKYKKAREIYLLTGDDTGLRSAQIALNEAWEAFRKAEAGKEKILQQQGLSLSKDEVAEALIEVHGNITSRFRTELTKAFDQLVEIKTAQQWREFVDAIVDRICARFQETKFGE